MPGLGRLTRGGRGLMQSMPGTVRELGVSAPSDSVKSLPKSRPRAPAGTWGPAHFSIRTQKAHFRIWAPSGKIFVQTTAAVSADLQEAVDDVLSALDHLERVARMQSTDVRINGLVRGARDAVSAVSERHQKYMSDKQRREERATRLEGVGARRASA